MFIDSTGETKENEDKEDEDVYEIEEDNGGLV